MNNYQQMLAVLAQERLLLTGHLQPDADCLCAMMALYLAFDGEKRGWQVVLEDQLPPNLDFLPGFHTPQRPEQVTGDFSGLLLLDCHELRRASSGWADAYKELPRYIIDHHEGEPDSAAVVVKEPESCAASFVVYKLLQEAGRPLTPEVAQLLYCGMVADTGNFRFSNTDSAALLAASELLTYGVDLEAVRINLFERRTEANLRLLAAALSNMELRFSGRVCLLRVSLADKERWQAAATDCVNIVGHSLLVEGVQLGAFLEERADEVKVSLRCRDRWQVDGVAAAFGGGGHRKAAGCRLRCSLAEAQEEIAAALGALLKEDEG